MFSKKTNRRAFLKNSVSTVSSAVALPYAITSTALGNQGVPAASERITVGHIGVGGQGGGLLRGFLNVDACQSVAVCDCFATRRTGRADMVNKHYAKQNTKANKGCATYTDFRELLARDDIDAVVVATPDHWHVPVALAAARAGKDMYVEKPLGLSMRQNIALREAIGRYGNIFQYGTQQRRIVARV